MAHLATLSRWTFGLAVATWLGVHAVHGQEPAFKYQDPVLYGIMIAALVLWAVAAQPLRDKRYTVALGRNHGHRTLEFIPPQKPVNGRKKSLRSRAQTTAAAVHNLLDEYNATDPLRQRMFAAPPEPSRTPEERDAAFREDTRLSFEHSDRMMRKYERELSADALWCYDEFHNRGMTNETQRSTFEWPTNTFGLREVAQSLEVWARQL